jgi:Na+/phosphate symporter
MTTSRITNQVIEDIERRAKVGLETYGTTMDRSDLSELDWLNHMYEELLDAAIYTKKIIDIKKNSLGSNTTSTSGHVAFSNNNQYWEDKFWNEKNKSK